MATSGSLGVQRVRESSNPSRDELVDSIKRFTADLIDLCDGMRGGNQEQEKNRLLSLAQTAYEEAAMWATKAATTYKE